MTSSLTMGQVFLEKLSNFNRAIKSEGWQTHIEYDVSGHVLKKGLELLLSKGDLLLPICLNNGYYSRENIYRLMRFSLEFSNSVQIFFTDGPAKHNYRAIGEREKDIVRECRLHRNRLRNHCLHGLERINTERGADNKYSITFLEWQNIYKDPAYLESHDYLKKLYSRAGNFRRDINKTTRKVLINRMGEMANIDDKIRIAIEYVLEELAFIMSYSRLNSITKPVASHGVEGFNYIYYESWPVFENLSNGVYDDKVREEIGFSIVRIS